MIYILMIKKTLGIENDYIAECIFKRMVLDFSECTAEEFQAECKRASDEFVNECETATQGS